MSNSAHSETHVLPRKLRRLLAEHERAVEGITEQLHTQLSLAQSNPIADPRQELLPMIAKELIAGDTIVLASTNSLDELYRGNFTQIPIDITPPPPRKPKAPAEINKKRKKKRFLDHDKREIRWQVDVKDGAMKARPGRGLLLYKDGTLVLVHDFLGEQRTELIVRPLTTF